MPSDGSVTVLIQDLRAGDREATRKLWDLYFPRLVPLAHKYLDRRARRVADGEDVALSVLKSFCLRAEQGQFSRLQDRDDLWSLLAAITAHKAIDARRRASRKQRGEGRVRAAADLDESAAGQFEAIVDPQPTPETVVAMAEELARLFQMLPDESLRRVAMMRMQGYTVPEIATQLGRITRAIERKLNRIRNIWAEQVSDIRS